MFNLGRARPSCDRAYAICGRLAAPPKRTVDGISDSGYREKGEERMDSLRSIIKRLRAGLRRLRSLTRDEDHDDWYDTHGDTQNKPPNVMGPGSQSGG